MLVGSWVSTDPQQRWSLKFADDNCLWVERSAAGQAVIRTVAPAVAGESCRIERANDAEVLAFLGARPEVGHEILGRAPGPSSMVVNRIDRNTASAEWTGLFWTLDANNRLSALGFRSRSFTLRREGA